MIKGWRTWLHQEDLLLEKLRFQEQKTIKECAKILGRSFRSVESRVSKFHLWRPYTCLKFIELLTKPHTLKGAAKEAGVPIYTIKKAKQDLRKMNIDVFKCSNAGAFKSIDPRRNLRWERQKEKLCAKSL